MRPLHHAIYFLLLLGLSSLMSCKSSKRAADGFRERSTTDLLRAVEKHNNDFEWFSGKAKINFESSYESGRGVANVRVKKDSVIWMNFKKFGLEFARLQITPDSIYVMYRFENYYERGSISEYSREYGIDLEFDKVQSFLVGNCLLPEPQNARVTRVGDAYELISSSGGYTVQYEINPVTLTVNKHKIIDEQGREVVMSFDDYKRVGSKRYYSHTREYFAPLDDSDVGRAKINISSVEFNVPKSIPFDIPDHYTTYDN